MNARPDENPAVSWAMALGVPTTTSTAAKHDATLRLRDEAVRLAVEVERLRAEIAARDAADEAGARACAAAVADEVAARMARS